MRITESQIRRLIRNYLINEIDFTADRMTGGHASDFGKTMSAVSKMSDKELKKSATNLINAFKDGSPDKKTIGQLLDPTGISSIPDIPPAIDEFERKPSLMNGVILVLSVLAVLPLAGKLAKLGGKTLTRLSKNLKKAEKSLPVNSKPVYKKAISAVDSELAKIKLPVKGAVDHSRRMKKIKSRLKKYPHNVAKKFESDLKRLTKQYPGKEAKWIEQNMIWVVADYKSIRKYFGKDSKKYKNPDLTDYQIQTKRDLIDTINHNLRELPPVSQRIKTKEDFDKYIELHDEYLKL